MDKSIVSCFLTHLWASAHRGKWRQLTPWKMDEKLTSENMQKRAVFYIFVTVWEKSGQTDVENGAIYSDILQNAPFCSQMFKNFLRLRRQGGIDPPNQNPADVPGATLYVTAMASSAELISGCGPLCSTCMEHEVEGPRPRGRPKRTWTEVVKEDCLPRKLNKEDAVDRSKWRKLIKDVRWSGWVWVGECFFWYRPTRVVPDHVGC